MSDSESVANIQDNSAEFRKCWSLGEAFYYLENNYNDLFEYPSEEKDPLKFYSKLIRLYRSQLVAVVSICSEFEIRDSKINEFINNLHKVLNAIQILDLNKDRTKLKVFKANINFEEELESYLIGNLIGKDPRYDHIFRIAKHSMELYNVDNSEKQDSSKYKKDKNQNDDQSRYRNLWTDLENIKNFVKRDKFSVIHVIIENWSNISKCFLLYKSRRYNGGDELQFDKYKQPGLIEIVNRIRGLVTGTLEIDDLLKRQDRICWVMISYVFIISIFLIMGIIICLGLKFDPFLYFSNLASTEGSWIFNVPLLTLLIGIIAGFIKSAIPLWQKWSDWITLKIAIWRIKNPGKTNYLFNMLIEQFLSYLKHFRLRKSKVSNS